MVYTKDSNHTCRTKPHPGAQHFVTPLGVTFLSLALQPQSDLIVVGILSPKLVPFTHAYHIPLCLQPCQLRTPWAQVWGGRLCIA